MGPISTLSSSSLFLGSDCDFSSPDFRVDVKLDEEATALVLVDLDETIFEDEEVDDETPACPWLCEGALDSVAPFSAAMDSEASFHEVPTA